MLSGNEFRNLARQQGVAILDKGNETDFLKEIEQTGLQQNHHVAFMAGRMLPVIVFRWALWIVKVSF